MNLWTDAFDDLSAIERDLEREGSATIDQRLEIAKIKAILNLGQELSTIQDQGVNPEWSQRLD